MSCNKCKYWKAESRWDYHGECTRYPQWADVTCDHYCGEFKERDGE